MSGAIRKLVAAAILGVAFTAMPLTAQDIRIEPIPPQVKPQWTQVPNAPGVFWAPNIPTDVFRHGSKYYFYWAGYLYQGSKPQGPWKGLTKVPAWFAEIDPTYFKTVKKEPPTAPPAAPTAPSEGVAPTPLAPSPGPEEAPGAPAAPPQAPATPKVM